MVVLVTGSSGQLGKALQSIATDYAHFEFHFADSTKGDITDYENLSALFNKIKPNYCVNAAAYTAVDKAESEADKAQLVNVEGAKNLALICKEFNCTLLHISTDFVFDGTKQTPYTETDSPNPQGIYGQTKLDGEKAIQQLWHKHFIVRTSWVFSEYGNNFMKTMLRLSSERDSISVVNDQLGTPTNAVDLAKVLLQIVNFDADATSNAESLYGIYNFSNLGQCSWYEFAEQIFEVNNIKIDLKSIPTSAFPTAAKRPKYSVLDKSKVTSTFNIQNRHWKDAINAQ